MMQEHEMRLCLNVPLVTRKMAEKRISIKQLAAITGKDEHTVARYLKQPDKVSLLSITAIGAALDLNEMEYEELVLRVNTKEKYDRIRRARGYGYEE